MLGNRYFCVDPLVGKIFKVQRLNILNFLGSCLKVAVGAPEALNACGELVRPGVIQAEIVEAGITPLLVV